MHRTNEKLLTNSRVDCYGQCPRMHYYRYELGLRTIVSADYFRLGGAVHAGLDHYFSTGDEDGALELATKGYRTFPDWATTKEYETIWMVEGAKVYGLLKGYFRHWESTQWKVLACEQILSAPLINPATGKASRNFTYGGKLDLIVELPDGRTALVEHKTTQDSLKEDADLWPWLRIDSQTSLYWNLCHDNGWKIDTVIYDGIRKPAIRLKVSEEPKDYMLRLAADTIDRPEFYYVRREIPRMQADLDEAREDLWAGQQLINFSQKNNAWKKVTSQCLKMGTCGYLKICIGDHDLNDGPPLGYEITKAIHPELIEESEEI